MREKNRNCQRSHKDQQNHELAETYSGARKTALRKKKSCSWGSDDQKKSTSE